MAVGRTTPMPPTHQVHYLTRNGMRTGRHSGDGIGNKGGGTRVKSPFFSLRLYASMSVSLSMSLLTATNEHPVVLGHGTQ